MQTTDEQLKYTKLYNYVRGWLEARGLHQAITAIEFAKTLHTGMRKDGKTPEFSHQLHMVRFLMNLEALVKNPGRCITLIALHDTVEDDLASIQTIVSVFGLGIGSAVKLLSKKLSGHKLPDQFYYAGLLEDVDVCLVKGVDRLHNLESMAGAFTREKKLLYVHETENYSLPMLKQARNRYADHTNAFNLIRHIMIVYTKLVREELKAVQLV